MRLTLAALIIVAAAGPLWHPPLAATQTRAPLAILIDDGWAAAATWDARVRTADDVIARAADDRRAVALIPLSDGNARHFACARRIGARAAAPDETGAANHRPRRRAAGHRALPRRDARRRTGLAVRRHRSRRGGEFVKDLAQTLGQRAITIVSGGVPAPRALAAADNAAGGADA